MLVVSLCDLGGGGCNVLRESGYASASNVQKAQMKISELTEIQKADVRSSLHPVRCRDNAAHKTSVQAPKSFIWPTDWD